MNIKWESCPPYTHQQNGLVERSIRHITTGGRVQLAMASLGDEFWFDACKDFTSKSNLLPHQALEGDTPFERVHPNKKPRYQSYRKFGQTAYIHIDKARQGILSRGPLNKMHPRTERGILIGHEHGGSAYKIYLPHLERAYTSSAVSFDDILPEKSFLEEEPDHWVPSLNSDDIEDVTITKNEPEKITKDDLPEASHQSRSCQSYRVGPEQMETLFDEADQATCMFTIFRY